MTKDKTCLEIKEKSGIAKTFLKCSEVLMNRKDSIRTTKIFVNIWSILLYDCESDTLKYDTVKLEV